MRLTESRLRRVIRQVIREVSDLNRIVDKKEFFHAIADGVGKVFPVSNKHGYEQTYSFEIGEDYFEMKINNKPVNFKLTESDNNLLDDLWENHAYGNQYMPISECVKSVVSYLEDVGLRTSLSHDLQRNEEERPGRELALRLSARGKKSIWDV